jgi:endoglycosylceramidase
VIIDFHQDLYAEFNKDTDKSMGNGAPQWAIHNGGHTLDPVEPWALNYLQPAIRDSFEYFWTTSMKDDYLNMVKYTVDKLNSLSVGGASYILAVDVMNEPFKQDVFSFEANGLTQFYKDAAAKMPKERIAVEPGILADSGLPTGLNFDSGSNRGLFAPHYYDALFQVGGYNSVVEQILWTAMRGRVKDANRMKIPMLFGEWGAGVQEKDSPTYVSQFIKACDAHTVGWMWYSYDRSGTSNSMVKMDGSEMPVMDNLVRIYARAIGGTEPRFWTEGKKFTVTWKKLATVTAPTELFIPPRFKGIQVFVNGAPKAYTLLPARPNIMNIPTTADNMKVEVLWA